MKPTRFSSLLFALLLIALVLAGCTTPQADACPTTEPASCPTTAACPEPQACPTTVLSMPELNGYYWGMTDNADVVVTFNPGDECTMEVKHTITSAQWAYEIVVNDQAYQNYIVVAMTLAEGYTLKDLHEYGQSAIAGESPPAFAQLKMMEIVNPMSRTFHGITFTGKPIYFSCLGQTGTEKPKVLNEFEAIKVLEN